jgi:3-oxoisoapionate decarboxylase
MVNNVSLIETPQQTVETLAPFALFVSFKDIGVDFYDQGILLSEVPLGEGHFDLPAFVASMQMRNPKMLFQLEMLTRDPLKVPIFTDQYWKVFDQQSPVPPQDLAMLIGWVRSHPPRQPLPKTTGLDAAGILALEDALNLRSIEYARAHLPTLA